MSLASTVNNLIFKRTSTFAVVIVASVFFFERTLDVVVDKAFEKHNEGKLWKHIKHNYEE